MLDRKPAFVASPPSEVSHFSYPLGKEGWGFRLPFLNRRSTLHHEEGTSVNRPHSRGIKEPLHWFVLEAVLLICLPMNECISPDFLLVWTMALKSCINWPDVIPREWHAFGGVWERLSFWPQKGDATIGKANRWPLTASNQGYLARQRRAFRTYRRGNALSSSNFNTRLRPWGSEKKQALQNAFRSTALTFIWIEMIMSFSSPSRNKTIKDDCKLKYFARLPDIHRLIPQKGIHS